MKRLIVIMGVAGCGKSTVGQALSADQSWMFLEGDDFHPPENISLMASGSPLTDDHRQPWIAAILRHVDEQSDDNIVLACSALTPFVQAELEQLNTREIVWVLLEADKSSITERMQSRDHFMPESLMDSQFEALKPPQNAVVLSAQQPVAAIVSEILERLAAT